MKRFLLVTGLIGTITFILILVTLLVMALIYDNKYSINDSIVFVESYSSESIKEGMGFVYKEDATTSYIITNYHVIYDSENIYVHNLDNKKEKASIVDYDIYTDIAILEIEDNLNLGPCIINDNKIEENDIIYYFNINKRNIEKGTVLNLDNEININANYGNSFYNAISINADIENGNSGGPLFNINDEVVGVISLKEEDNDIGFYIPIDSAMDIVTKLENHTLVRPNLGATFANSTNIEMLNQYGINTMGVNGIVILEATENYPLYVSGLTKGDIITKINDEAVFNVVDMQKIIYSYDIGDTITLEYYRNNILSRIDITLNK